MDGYGFVDFWKWGKLGIARLQKWFFPERPRLRPGNLGLVECCLLSQNRPVLAPI